MKKWLAACLLAIALLFVTTAAMAAHKKTNGESCIGSYFNLVSKTETTHTLYCDWCKETFTEDHWAQSGNEATCAKKALCGGCVYTFGEADGPHDYGDWTPNGNGTHTRTCKRNCKLDNRTETENCTFSTTSCTEPVACTKCHESYTLGHDWGGWTPNGDKTHTRVCTRDPSHPDTQDCGDFQEANCTTPEMCLVCRGTYGDKDPDKHDWWMFPESHGDGTHTYTCSHNSDHTKTEACNGFDELSCGERGYCSACMEEYTASHKLDGSWASDADGHWQTCLKCSESQSKAPHSFVELADAKHLKSEATCVSVAVYYKSCSECGYHATDTFESGDINPNNHDLESRGYKAPTCTEGGWTAHEACQREGCGYLTPHQRLSVSHSLISHNGKTPTCTEIGWKAYETCGRCDYTTYQELPIDPDNHDLEHHEGKAATCTEKGWSAYDTCKRCDYTSYQGLDALDHDWNDWTSNGNGTHTRTCENDPGHTETEACSGVDCGQTGACSVCNGEYTAEHEYEPWSKDANEHWSNCIYCSEERRSSHSFEQYEHSEATCASPAKYYKICSDCSYQVDPYDFGDIDPNNHDLIHHAAKAATCTEIGWEAYDTCSRCDYTTYVELNNGGHSLTHYAAQAPTCAEVGWEAYDACSRCDYTTYVELPALGHDYQEEVIPRTCEQDGFTLHSCLRCGDDYTDNVIGYLGHWYGEWTANGEGAHTAACRRDGCYYKNTVDCELIELPALGVSVCHACGSASDGSRLALTNASVQIISGRIPYGEPLLRLGALANGEKLLTLGYVYGGRLSKASCQVKITLPAELLAGYTLSLLNADGTETALEYALEGDSAVLTLTFAQPLLAVRLAPAM